MGDKERTNISSGTAWEPLRGYSRAVRMGDTLFISGTTAINDRGEVAGIGDHYYQTQYIIGVMKRIVEGAGFRLSDVVRTRLYVTDMSMWKRYARAHHEAFEKIRPASSIVEVSRLTDPRLLVEMEAEAVLGGSTVKNITVRGS